MKYTLNATEKSASKPSVLRSLKRLVPVMQGEKRRIIVALCAVLVTSAATLIAPALIGQVIDGPIMQHDMRTVFIYALILLGLYVVSLCSSYVQTKTMGTVGRYVLFNLRNALFKKLQELPLDFFNQLILRCSAAWVSA